MARHVHVFAGPTLSGREIRRILPEAVVHPPVAAGDLLSMAVAPGDTVVLVDGLQASGRAVRHREILGLVDQGVEVWGAGALGALRAAELQPFGVRLYGRVARLAARGILEGDDEVAVDHAGADGRWAARTVALVDVRAACRRACRGGLIDPETADQVVATARALPFRRRRWEEILGRAVEAGLDPEMAWRVEQLASRAPRLTEADALGCLEAVRRRHGAPPRPRPGRAARPFTTVYQQRWAEERSGSVEHGAGFVSAVSVLTFCRLLGVDYPALQRRVALQTLAAAALPPAATAEREGQAMLRDFAADHRLDPGALNLWLVERGLGRAELLAHLRRQAAVRAFLDGERINPRNEAAADAALAEVVAEHARRRGFISASAARSWERAWLSAAELESLGDTERVARLASRTFLCAPGVDWRGPVLAELKVRGVFRVAREGAAEAVQHWRDAQDADPGLARECRDPEHLLAWAAQRWGAGERFDLALLDRGLRSRDELFAAAPMYCALDREVDTYRDLHCLGQAVLSAR